MCAFEPRKGWVKPQNKPADEPQETKTMEETKSPEVAQSVTADEVKTQPVAEAAPVVEKKKHRATTPWKPASLTSIPEKYRRKGLRYRFAAIDDFKKGNIAKKQAEGWVIDKDVKADMEKDGFVVPTLHDTKGLDGAFIVRDLVLMHTSEENASARNEYFSGQADQMFKDGVKKFKEDVKRSGGKVYGDVKINADE